MIEISQLLHVYLAQYGQYFPYISHFVVISVKYEKLGKYWPYCTQYHAITNAYSTIKMKLVDVKRNIYLL